MPLTLTTHDTRFDDPDPLTIAKVLSSLDGDRNVIAALERSEAEYLHAEGSAGAGLALEYQDGTIDRRYRCRAGALPVDRVSAIFQAYAQGGDAWRDGLEWDHVPYVTPTVPWFSTWWGYILALVAVAALIWWWRG